MENMQRKMEEMQGRKMEEMKFKAMSAELVKVKKLLQDEKYDYKELDEKAGRKVEQLKTKNSDQKLRISELKKQVKELSGGALTITDAAESARRAVECAGFQGECAVCFEQPARFAILLPCTHMCVCFDCAQRLTACPVCRVPIRARQPFLMAIRPASAEI